MNHFPVLLINSDKDIKESLIMDRFKTFSDRILLVDEMEKYESKYVNDEILLIKDADGNLYPYWSTAWFREPTEEEFEKFGPFKGNGKFGELQIVSLKWIDGVYRPMVFSLPDGCSKVLGTPNLVYNFEQYLYQYVGFRKLDKVIEEEDGVVVDTESNEIQGIAHWLRPNAIFDSYRLGGRYYDFFPLKDDCNKEEIRLGEKEVRSITDKLVRGRTEGVSSALKGDIDFEAIISKRKWQLSNLYDELRSSIEPYIKKKGVVTRSEMLARMRSEVDVTKIKQIEQDFYGQEITKAFLSAVRSIVEAVIGEVTEDYVKSLFDFEDFYITKTDYIKENLYKGILPFAVIKNEELYRHDEEESTDKWLQTVKRLVKETPDNARISVYDCTI